MRGNGSKKAMKSNDDNEDDDDDDEDNNEDSNDDDGDDIADADNFNTWSFPSWALYETLKRCICFFVQNCFSFFLLFSLSIRYWSLNRSFWK